MLKKWTYGEFVFFLLITIILGMFFTAMVGCQVLKGKRETRTDSSRVVKVDSGTVNLRTNDRQDSIKWWRETVYLSRDTVVNKIYPTTYVREGGTHTIREVQLEKDSSWKQGLDSLSKKLSEVEKSKETKAGTMWYIWVMLGLLGVLVLKGIVPFKIVKT